MVAKLTGTYETHGLQLKLKEDALAERRIEVATLHEACAKYKVRARTAPIKLTPFTTTPGPFDAVCLRCEKAKDFFGEELKVALEGLADKLKAAFAEKEAKFSSALR